MTFREQASRIPVVVRYEILKQLRRFRLYALMVLGAVVTALVSVLGLAVLGKVPALDFCSLVVTGVVYFAMIAGVFFSGDAIASEFEHKTGYMIFPNPVNRTALLIGKYLSSCIACALVVLMPYLVLAISVGIGLGEVPVQLVSSFLLALLYSWSVAALTFVFSSLFKGSMGATALPFLLLFFVFNVVTAMFELVSFEPFLLLTYASGTISQVLMETWPPPSMPFSQRGSPISLTFFYPSLLEGVVIMLSYLFVGLILSVLIVRRRQMA